ncbi:M14 family zinc carboxypeptidase [Anderseniella sp. Alg231-50]|uniref:M14 family zinc carboxypeptidase n=1 Tax=Anderseniella sp. Alg231-50 TaxID=1922226 RepID=UPI000D5629B4
MAICSTINLPRHAVGTQHSLKVWQFGEPGASPKVYIQASMHADELPASLAAAKLLPRLMAADEAGKISGEIILVPVANPIGLNNVSLRSHNGRHHLPTGENYNRGFHDVSDQVLDAIDGKMANGPEADTALVKREVAAALAAAAPANEAQALRLELMRLACDADIVLDLHTDSEAQMHLYLDEDHWPKAADLAGLLDARVVMFARASGGGPFEETIAWPYVRARETYGADAVELPLTVVVELRGEYDASHALSDFDADAMYRFLCHRGAITEGAGLLPEFTGVAAPFSATDTLTAKAAGIVVYTADIGQAVKKGDVLVEIIDPLADGNIVVDRITAAADGVFFARSNQRLAWPGETVGKVQGTEVLAHRTGKLLYD